MFLEITFPNKLYYKLVDGVKEKKKSNPEPSNVRESFLKEFSAFRVSFVQGLSTLRSGLRPAVMANLDSDVTTHIFQITWFHLPSSSR